MKKFLLLTIISICSIPVSAATKIPTLKVCLSSSGALTAKQKCSKSEKAVTLQNIATQGPQGPQGVPGINGTFNTNKCTYRFANATATTVVTTELNCAPNEFLLVHGVQPSTVQADVIQMALLFNSGEQMASGVQYTLGTNAGALTFSISVEGVCCLP